jgi:protein transport protein SEC61 subunit gamma and related proteins
MEELTTKQKIRRFYNECIRVLKITRKPDAAEFKTIVKVSGLGLAVIGVIGFIITMIKQLLF